MNDNLYDKISASYLDYLISNPEAHVGAIVRCQALRPDYVSAAERSGLIVARQLRLLQGLVVEGRAANLLALSEKSWVLSIEPDEPVHTMRQERSQ
jgi:hypothetical protein